MLNNNYTKFKFPINAFRKLSSASRTKRCLLFVVSFLSLFLVVNLILHPKYNDGIAPMKEFYTVEENTLDVVCFGSSHMFLGISPITMWSQKGIASFDLCGSVQPLYFTYYYMKECLKYQKPKVMVLDIYMTVFPNSLAGYSTIIKNTYGLKMSQDKLDMLSNHTPEDIRLDLLLGFPAYHSRYKDLKRQDFDWALGKEHGPLKGYYAGTKVTQIGIPEGLDETGRMSIAPDAEKYLLDIIKLANDNDVQLLFILVPYVTSVEEQQKFNTVSDIADAHGIEMINYTKIDLQLTPEDFQDAVHLNYYGGQKVTAHLAEYLAENYDISNRHGDPDYADWHSWADEAEFYLLNKK